MKTFIWFLIFLGLGMLFGYFAANIKNEINSFSSNEHNDPNFDFKILKVLFTSICILDLGFVMASFWNLYKFIKLIFKKEENK
ncbi:MAG: hypothetical protein HPAVJP_5580 [Candidatus Hepatoplasma vulgare]|nr:MAG: hypothetical protein HPAVJP_5580 [Candidatus Hepatoplasma sp.]